MAWSCRRALVAAALLLPSCRQAGRDASAPASISPAPTSLAATQSSAATQNSDSAPTPASTPSSTASAIPTTAPAPLAALPLKTAAAITGAARVPLAAGGEFVVDPSASFEVELDARIPDARAVLLDATDAIVPSTGEREIGAATRLTVAPAAPLTPGSRYVLRVEGTATRALHAADGKAYAPVSLAVLAAGEPPPPPPRAKRRHKR